MHEIARDINFSSWNEKKLLSELQLLYCSHLSAGSGYILDFSLLQPIPLSSYSAAVPKTYDFNCAADHIVTIPWPSP